MKTLHTHDLEMEKKFDEEFFMLSNVKVTHYYGEDYKKAKLLQEMCDRLEEDLKSFITNNNKQLYIKIAKGEIEYWKNIFDNPPKREKEYPCDNCTRNICRLEIEKWNNILQELNK